MPMLRVLPIAVAFCFVVAGCSDDSPPSGQPSPEVLFGGTIDHVDVEVDYAEGAEPFTGGAGPTDDLWGLTRANLGRLFQSAGATVNVPSTLAEMENIGTLDQEDFSTGAILDLADDHRDELSEGSRATFYVLFLDGYFSDESGRREDVLGLSLGSTGVIALFKPVIESTGGGAIPTVMRFVEQTTLVHELGHAVGLVDNGLPMVTDHLDAEHGAHCVHDDCVMFWANEGASDMREFVRQYVTSGDVILFGDDCLADVDAASSP